MSASPFDLEALTRAVVIALGVGLIVMALGFVVTREPEERRRWKPVLLSGTAGVIFILIIGIYYAWPSLMIVPSLDGESQAQAEELLLRRRLVPNARPQYAAGVAKDTVIPKSQDPAAGLAVKAGTVVTFAISASNVSLPGGPRPTQGLFSHCSGLDLAGPYSARWAPRVSIPAMQTGHPKAWLRQTCDCCYG